MSEKHYQTAAQDRISLKQKSAYAIGMLVNNLQAAALPAMVVILNLGLGMDPLWVGLIGAVPRIFDAISDPMIGYISDNSRTRWGRRRPFIFAGALTAGLIFALMWQLPSGYIDILSSTPVKPHQVHTQSLEQAQINDAGAAELLLSPTTNRAEFIFYGPKSQSRIAANMVRSNLSDFPQLELGVKLPESGSFEVIFQEAGGSEFTTLVTPQDAEAGSGTLFKLPLDRLQPTPTSSGDSPNLTEIENIRIRLLDPNMDGMATIQSLKLRKSEDFFVFYFRFFMFMSIVFFLAYTMFATPFVAFGYEMTPDYHERTRLHAFANTVGQLAWLGVPWFYAIMASSLFRDTVHGARTLAIVVGIVIAVLGILPAIFLRERQVISKVEDQVKGFWQNMSEFFKGILTTFKCKPFVQLCGATFLVFNGFQLGISFSLYIMIYYLFNGSNSAAGNLNGWYGMLTSIATLGVIPLTGWIATRMGKRKTFLLTISISIFGYALKWFGYNPDIPYLLLIATPFVAFGTGSLFTLMGSMISDVCDYDELTTHQRREGVFGAIYWWMVKVGMALAGLMTGILLKFSGFDVALGSGQTEQTMFLLRTFDVGIPIVTSALALWIIARYSITEKRAYDIRCTLEERRGKVTAVDVDSLSLEDQS